VTGRPVEAVSFDLYGTLVDLGALEGACDVAAPGHGAELAAHWRRCQIEATWLRNAMDRWADFSAVTEEALAVAATELGIALDPAQVTRTLLPAWRTLPARPGVETLLDALAAASVPAGILSNGSQAMLAATVDGAAGLGGRFRWRLSVDEVRRYKPSPEVYALASGAAGVAPPGIGFVTANAWDGAGAAAFGFRVAWLRAPGAALPAVGPLAAEPVAVTLDEVSALFGV
jgi:2-haloacid dehalogenase